ncbi:Cob(I)yrinic acid a,c-diamide adenosyltransferase [Maioricimonas rarisocia]|uniref:Corrinoid adenosyltransferase n=1 Tax=Maioricimonas rarisocia TaxID=2528026 RepID=A0A517ZE06_9PLAN|nr:cob(I)yrinic acid a,c-diamide adenosyltransferase [Maioricimonas rarisocia]QDU40716.1 Cob(I)yrinic acid a,c-diamide adenosyltransferase [Maioricimonas rarisocia]
MVHLNRIYTRAGDDGQTHLGNMQRVPKTSLRIEAYGGVDELNAVLGVAACEELPETIAVQLLHIQNDLFDVGADLCVPESKEPPDVPPLRVLSGQVEQLERWIDEHNEPLEPLKSFILPGGSPAAARLHHARTVCRRVEIGVLRLAEAEPVNRQVSVYLNRLSDLLFVMARVCNDDGRQDVLWTPGKNRQGEARPSE